MAERQQSVLILLAAIYHVVAAVGCNVLLRVSPDVGAEVLLPVLTGQVALLGTWLGLGSQHFATRLISSVMGAIALTALPSLLYYDDRCYRVTAPSLVIVAGVTWLARLAAVKRAESAPEERRSDRRITTRHLFAATTCVAVVLAVWRVVPAYTLSYNSDAMFLAMGTGYATNALLVVWAWYRVRGWMRRSGSTIICAATIGWLAAEVTYLDVRSFITSMLIQACVLVPTLVLAQFVIRSSHADVKRRP